MYPEKIPSLFKENLSDSKVYFVFPTDTVMNSWIDWIVLNPDQSGTDAVPLERFLAWDNFKRNLLSAHQTEQTAIPTLLRDLFVNDLIEKNALKPREERLQVIINPDDEITKSANSFADWISSNLISLHFWKKRITEHAKEYGELDAEDKDYLYLYEQYSAFLNKYNLFEPSWIENLEFEDKENKYFIIYPELLQDFEDYKEVFAKSDNITAYVLPKDIPSPKAYLYPDSRKELRTTMLQIIDLVQNKKADWSEIALSIPDIETYRPYIQREFDLYQIPYVIKAGQPLTKNNAGRIFREIYNCYNTDFSFESVRTLVLDECVPWKDEYIQLKENLVREGNRMRCICSPYETNIWLSAFNSKINRLQKDPDQQKYFEDLKSFFQLLQKTITHFFDTQFNTFENIRRCWMEFKSIFLKDDKDFTEEANNILSRCIKELESIIQIEKDYEVCNLKIQSPYNFFLKILDEKTYTPQTKATGVQIFKYKLSAAANFKYQFVIDSSQKNLEITYKRLTFLTTTKRSKLHLLEDDKTLNATEAYMKLYAKTTSVADQNFVHFSAATDTFAGFAIPHNLLQYDDKNLPDLDSKDYILNEQQSFLSKDTTILTNVTDNQKQMFQNWKQSSLTKAEPYHLNQKMKELLQTKYDSENKLPNISARGDLEKFFPCPRVWVFNSLLHFHDDSLDTDLMKGYDMGNLNHKILELFFSTFEHAILPYYDKTQNLFLVNKDGNITDCTSEIDKKLDEIVKTAILSIKDFRDSPLVIHSLQDQQTVIKTSILNFLKQFLIPFIDRGFGSCTIEGIEVPKKVAKEKYNYTGRIDCLLKSPESDFIIIDFKNTKSAIPKVNEFMADENSKLLDFQMPLYYKLVTETTGNDVCEASFLAIKDFQKQNVFYIDPPARNRSLEDFTPTLHVLDEYADLFTTVIKKQDFTPYNSNKDKDKLDVRSYTDCISCPFKIICRTTYSVAAKQLPKPNGDNDD